MVLGYGLSDLKAHMNEIIKVTTTERLQVSNEL